jgi:4-hydroxybenzoyl-CoA reductase subunit beta
MLPLPRFSYEAPDELDDAVALLAAPDAMPMSGGTDLLPSMKHRLFTPDLVVSTRRLAALRQVTPTADGGLSIGAGLSLREVGRLAPVVAAYPALAAACRTVATPTLQAMATLGGNVMLDTRCMYYNQPAGWRASVGYCLKREGTVCHVAPKGKGCYAAHSADTIPALWLYGAEVELASTAGTRRVAIADLYADDGIAWLRARRGELVTRVILPPATTRVTHQKLRTRAAIDYAWLLLAVGSAGRGAPLRAVISAIGPKPIVVEGADPTALAEAAFKACQPLTTHLLAPPYRKRMVRVEVRRTAESLA